MENQQKTLAQMVQENTEREVRVLIGDLQIALINHKIMLALMQQEPVVPAPPPTETPQPPQPQPMKPIPQPEDEPPLDRPEKRGNGKAPREVIS